MANQRHKDKDSVSAWIDKALKDRIKYIADRDGRNISDVVNKILREQVEKYEVGKSKPKQ